MHAGSADGEVLLEAPPEKENKRPAGGRQKRPAPAPAQPLTDFEREREENIKRLQERMNVIGVPQAAAAVKALQGDSKLKGKKARAAALAAGGQ